MVDLQFVAHPSYNLPMNLGELILQTFFFFLTLWLGGYLIARDPRRLQLWLAGAGMITFALGVATALLEPFAPTAVLALNLYRTQRLFILLSSLLWLWAMIRLIPNRAAWKEQYSRRRLIMIVSLYGIILSAIIIANMPTLSLGVTVFLGLDLFAFGLIITMLDASDQGEAWFSHFLRSLDYAFFTALIFAGQVMLVMAFWTGISFPMVLLLISSVITAVFIQTFAAPVQSFIDQIAFFNAPRLRQTRAIQRTESDSAQRLDVEVELLALDNKEFARLTRKALSQMGNLPKLASNPLTRLPLVTERLRQNGQSANTLARAAELKAILRESIDKLKPQHDANFGMTDEWRHYNALYFLYVVGLRPYSRRTHQHEEYQEVLHWFRSQIPERTLYNWQTAAAQLVARNLRELSYQ
ncbi:MAG: hypothetical protein GY805_30660 [Chloroflexi bacterium]|nr:hypothetical protein [Chloroflexota bacterium]